MRIRQEQGTLPEITLLCRTMLVTLVQAPCSHPWKRSKGNNLATTAGLSRTPPHVRTGHEGVTSVIGSMSACTGQARGNTCRAPAEARDAEPRALPLLTLAAWVHHRATLLLEFAAAFSSAPGFAAPLPLLPLPLPLPLLMQCLGSTNLPNHLALPTFLTNRPDQSKWPAAHNQRPLLLLQY